MDSLRQSIGLRAPASVIRCWNTKAEAFKIFDELMVNIKNGDRHNVFRSASSLRRLRFHAQRADHHKT